MEMFRKTWLTPLRSRACSTAAATAASCTVPNDSRDLGDLLDGAGARGRGLGEHVHVLAAPEPFDHPRQPLLGHLADAGVQPGQVAGDLAAEPDEQEDRRDDGDQADAARQDGLGDQPAALRRAHRRQLR